MSKKYKLCMISANDDCISIQQSNGALVDDLGNEIKIEGDSPIHTNASPRGLVVRKLPGITPLRSATVRANYMYTPTISSPHQPTLNRLVLTNAKLS